MDQMYFVTTEQGYFYGVQYGEKIGHPDPALKKGQTVAKGWGYNQPAITWFYSDEPVDKSAFFREETERRLGCYRLNPEHRSVKFLTDPPAEFIHEDSLREYLESQDFSYDGEEQEFSPTSPYELYWERTTVVKPIEGEWFELTLPATADITQPVGEQYEYEADAPYNWLVPTRLHYLFPGRLLASRKLLDDMRQVIADSFPKYGVEVSHGTDGKIAIKNLQTILGSWSPVGELKVKTFDFSGDTLQDATAKVGERLRKWIAQTIDEIENPTVKCPHCEGRGHRHKKKPTADIETYYRNVRSGLYGVQNQRNADQIKKILADLTRIENYQLTSKD